MTQRKTSHVSGLRRDVVRQKWGSWLLVGGFRLTFKITSTYELTVSSSLSLFHSVLINYSAFKSLVMNLWCSSTGHLNQSSQMAGPL